MKRQKFKKGDIVTLYDSLIPYRVVGYKTTLSKKRVVVLKRIITRLHPRTVEAWADESDLRIK